MTGSFQAVVSGGQKGTSMEADFTCSFCGRARREVRKLVSGPRIFICDACVEACVRVASPGVQFPPDHALPVKLLTVGSKAQGIPEACGFCGELRRDSRVAFGSTDPASSGRCICAGCVGLSIEIMEEEEGLANEQLRSWPEASAEVRDRRPTSR